MCFNRYYYLYRVFIPEVLSDCENTARDIVLDLESKLNNKTFEDSKSILMESES
jgi:hypothetical protein